MIPAFPQPSVMTHSFSHIPDAQIPRSTFNRSHAYKTTLDAGYLIPIYVDEALPGDTFALSMSSVARLTTPIVPFMDNLYMDFFFFAIPNRLVWDNWEKFMGAQTNPGDSTDYTVPILIPPVGGHAVGSLADYLGIPTGLEGIGTTSLQFRAYNLVWNEWFRDQNLQNSAHVDMDDGPDTIGDYVLLRRGKRHDYFTSCLPWPQKGTAVDLPLGSSAPVYGIGKATQGFPVSSQAVYETGGTSTTTYADTVGIDPTVINDDGVFYVEEDPNNAGYPGVYADLSSATAATINSLREAFQLQRMLERDARGGTRYAEIIRSHFNVLDPQHAVLQRPVYLGGGSTPVTVTPVAQTSETLSAGGNTPQGNLAAIGYQSSSNIGFTKSFTEHCILLGLVSVRADLTYQKGINRMWKRSTREDYYFPSLAHLGEQAVLNREIYWSNNPTLDDATFGYQERWAEYRYKPSLITGKLRSDAAGSLDVWHLSQDFGSLPVLNASFIEDNPPMARVLAVTNEPAFVFDAFFSVRTTRPMPTYSVPGLIDHF